ncbi:MAG: N-acetylmuramoyl-L-alanine amidase [Rudaea sp.]|nr:N-acetylmuramoyl-L-alanine amidase [Rudaea sp.]
MRGVVSKILLRLLGAALMLGANASAWAVDIQALHVSTAADSTRLIFDVSGPPDYKLFEIGNPDRVVLDIRAAGFSTGFAAPAGKGLLKTLRTGKQGKGDARVVLDLATAAHPKSFVLPPDSRNGYRLVVDLYPRDKAAHDAVKSVTALAAKPRNVVIAIDPGHGGVDPGATGSSGTHEKDITLAVSRELKRLIDKQSGMSAVLTRDDDTFIPLKERYQKARIAKADLFLSIHADAFASGDARGSSVWMLSSRGATSEAAHWLADRENRADLVGGVSLDDKDNTLAAVLLDLSQGATLEASGSVADEVLRALGRIGPTHRGYVEKANFVVLRSPDVPSILVETAFITNPAEEKRLSSPAQREKLAGAILDGIRNYFRATPPPGSLFAATAAREKPERLGGRKAPPVDTAAFAADDPDREILARIPKS